MNGRIALASSLRIGSAVSDADTFEVRLRKLKVAALLDAAHARALEVPSPSAKDAFPSSSEDDPLNAHMVKVPPSSDYSTFLDAILGKDNVAFKSKLKKLVDLNPLLLQS